MEAIEQLGGVVGYGRNVSARSPLLRQILGNDTFAGAETVDFWNPSQVTDADLVHFARMQRLKSLHLGNSQVSDAGLKHLAGLKDLSGLTLDNSQITDAGLVHLAGLKGLKHLAVYRTQVTEAGESELQKSLPDCKIRR